MPFPGVLSRSIYSSKIRLATLTSYFNVCRANWQSHQDSTGMMLYITFPGLRLHLSTIQPSSMPSRNRSPPSSSILTQTTRLTRPRLHPTGIHLQPRADTQRCSSTRQLRGHQWFKRQRLRMPFCSAVGRYSLVIIVYLL
jgi:hypothetical protein